MIEIIIGTTKYGFRQIETIITAQPDDPSLQTKAWITLKVDVAPQTNVDVVVNKESEPDYFSGQSQQVRRLEKGKYEVFCLGPTKVNSKASMDTKPSKSHLTLLSNESQPKQKTRKRKTTK